MEPKTKQEIRIVELSSKLPKLTEKQLKYPEDNLFRTWGSVSRNKVYCLECGYSWKEDSPSWHNEIVKPICPTCSSNLKMFKYNSTLFQEMNYFAILTKKENFQVVRMIASYKYMRKNQSPTYFSCEVMQHWIDENGEVRSLAKFTQTMGARGCYDLWIHNSRMEIKPKTFVYDNKYKLNPYKIYPERNIHPLIKRNGFKGHFYDIAPQIFFSYLLKDSTTEFLLKTKQTNVLGFHLSDSSYKVNGYLDSIRICIKNGYIIKDFVTWKDYVDLLKYFNKDLRNAKYTCPDDLVNAHDRLIKKKRSIQRKQKLSEMKAEIEKSQKKYESEKRPFLGLEFKDKEITVKVISTVAEFMEEGDNLSHCVFTNEYYNRPESLILSAKIGNNNIETIEISLSSFTIKQSRGKKNKATRYNKRIIKLVNQNMDQIRLIIKQQEKLEKRKNTINHSTTKI